jgi:hypothetical protein
MERKVKAAAKGDCLAPILARTQGTSRCILGDAMMDAAIMGDCGAVQWCEPALLTSGV